MQSISRTESDETAVNLTPMLDVVFILLIFFIVTATFIKEQGLPIDNPDPEHNPPPNPDSPAIVVQISSRDRIRVAGSEVDPHFLVSQFQQAHAAQPDAPVVINSHPESTADALVRAMDAARLAGIWNIKFAN